MAKGIDETCAPPPAMAGACCILSRRSDRQGWPTWLMISRRHDEWVSAARIVMGDTARSFGYGRRGVYGKMAKKAADIAMLHAGDGVDVAAEAMSDFLNKRHLPEMIARTCERMGL